MNEDAGNGGTRLDAAKQAVDTLVDRLPAGRAAGPARLRLEGQRGLARRGLQGHRADGPGRPAGQGRAARHRQRAQGQGPDADRQLAAGRAGRPRLRGRAAQRGPGHRRRRQLRAAGPLQGGRGRSPSAASTSRSRSSASRSTTACASSCAASPRPAAGPTSTSHDADKLGDELRGAALARVPLLRAGRDRGRRAARRASRRPRSAPGSSRTCCRATATQRWFSVDVPEGRRRGRLGDRDPAAGRRAAPARSSSICCDPARRRRRAFESELLNGGAAEDVSGATQTAERPDAARAIRRAATRSSVRSTPGGDGSTRRRPGRDRRPVLEPGETVGLVAPRRAGDADADADRDRRAAGDRAAPPGDDDSSALRAGWSCSGCVVAGIVVGLLAAARARPQGRGMRLALARAAARCWRSPARARAGPRRRRSSAAARSTPRRSSSPAASATRSCPGEYLYYGFKLEAGQQLHVTRPDRHRPRRPSSAWACCTSRGNIHTPTRDRRSDADSRRQPASARPAATRPLAISSEVVRPSEDNSDERDLAGRGRLLPRPARGLRGQRRPAAALGDPVHVHAQVEGRRSRTRRRRRRRRPPRRRPRPPRRAGAAEASGGPPPRSRPGSGWAGS